MARALTATTACPAVSPVSCPYPAICPITRRPANEQAKYDDLIRQRNAHLKATVEAARKAQKERKEETP